MIRKIERKAINLLLAGNDPVLSLLRIQYNKSSITSIEETGVGIYINYYIPDSEINLSRSHNFCFGDIEASVDEMKHGLGFVLFIQNGALSFLEIYTIDELWPKDIKHYRIDYIGGKRNILELKKAWS